MSRSNALTALETLYSLARADIRKRVVQGDKLSAPLLDEHQLAAHALAFLRTELEAARQLDAWAGRVGKPLESTMADAFIGELVRTLPGGVRLGPAEQVALADLGLSDSDVRRTILADPVQSWAASAASADAVSHLGRRLRDSGFGNPGYEDDTLEAMRAEFRKFCDKEVVALAQQVHRQDVLIPMSIIERMAELGVFGLTIDEQYGGLGLGKVAMCVVTEELSRGYIGVGSLGTRTEIAAELIGMGGTPDQKQYWLPKLASGEVLPTAVFTEPNFGSDLARIRTRAIRNSDGSFSLSGQKTWITHATRADLMTVLARSLPDEKGYRGLSMFLASKSRATAGNDFPDEGMTGTEIKVLGYRGMKEFELSFDGFRVAADGLLGGVEGQGFKQLMSTFESARIQTAARAVGVAQAALEDALQYAWERTQFGRPIVEFPRVSAKLGRIAVQVQAARQLALFAGREKDGERRCDLEAGMAKLLATRVAWEAADANVQIHGGNGYAEEYLASRLLVDARVLSIFEGANEIQAHVIARRLLEKGEE